MHYRHWQVKIYVCASVFRSPSFRVCLFITIARPTDSLAGSVNDNVLSACNNSFVCRLSVSSFRDMTSWMSYTMRKTYNHVTGQVADANVQDQLNLQPDSRTLSTHKLSPVYWHLCATWNWRVSQLFLVVRSRKWQILNLLIQYCRWVPQIVPHHFT